MILYRSTLELTLENLKTIKLWHDLLFKNKEETIEDQETAIKIYALLIDTREYQSQQDKVRGTI